MRKITTLIVAALYVIGIVVIGLFGMKIFNLGGSVYATNVVLMNGEIEQVSKDMKLIWLGDYYDGMTFQLEWKVYPEDATDKSVYFSFDQSYGHTVDENGLFTFAGGTNFTVKIVTADGSKKEDSVTLVFMAKPGA